MTEFKLTENNEQVELRIIGRLDEESDFSKLKMPEAKIYFFNLEELTTLNSMGLRNWLLWIKKLKVTIPKVFKNCQKNVVDQMNILQGFLPPGSTVESFYVPFYCSHCTHEENYKALRGKDFLESTSDKNVSINIPHSMTCPACKKNMEVDIIPQKYFAFLK